MLAMCMMKRVRGKIFALNRLKPLPDHLLSKLYQAFIFCLYLTIVMSHGQFLLRSSLSKSLESLHSHI